MEEFPTVAVAQYDAEVRVRALSARGSVDEALRVRDKLDVAFGHTTGAEGGDPRQSAPRAGAALT